MMRVAWLWVLLVALQLALIVRGDDPTPEPSAAPTAIPTAAPTAVPTAAPTLAPSAEPTPVSVFNRVSFVLTGLALSQVDTTKSSFVKQAIAYAFDLDVSAVSGLSITASSSVQQQQRRLGRRLAANAVNVAATVVSVTAPSSFSATKFQTIFQVYTGTTTTVSSLTVADITPTASPVASPTSGSSFSLPIDLIIGLTVGGAVLLAIGCGVSLWFGHTHKESEERYHKGHHDNDTRSMQSSSSGSHSGSESGDSEDEWEEVEIEVKDDEKEDMDMFSPNGEERRDNLRKQQRTCDPENLVACLSPAVMLGLSSPEPPRRAAILDGNTGWPDDEKGQGRGRGRAVAGGGLYHSPARSHSLKSQGDRTPPRGTSAGNLTPPPSVKIEPNASASVSGEHPAKSGFGTHAPKKPGMLNCFQRKRHSDNAGKKKGSAANNKKKKEAFTKMMWRILYRSIFVAKGVKRKKMGGRRKKGMIQKMIEKAIKGK